MSRGRIVQRKNCLRKNCLEEELSRGRIIQEEELLMRKNCPEEELFRGRVVYEEELTTRKNCPVTMWCNRFNRCGTSGVQHPNFMGEGSEYWKILGKYIYFTYFIKYYS